MGWYKEARLRRQPAGSHEPAPCLPPPGIRHPPLCADIVMDRAAWNKMLRNIYTN
jgi:hypothetical protein